MKFKTLLLFSFLLLLNSKIIKSQEIQITPRPQLIITGNQLELAQKHKLFLMQLVKILRIIYKNILKMILVLIRKQQIIKV